MNDLNAEEESLNDSSLAKRTPYPMSANLSSAGASASHDSGRLLRGRHIHTAEGVVSFYSAKSRRVSWVVSGAR
ncbi:hypothetical protein SAMN05443248_2746 [Bradyrhizobium erythrophlei]|uniref:Uncharacterized protein n=1 Tax=Bradyrhizobium erythrophlei TaxID=1437360 RepID=A0A1M5MW12_9BRAD|nr:hypothetical protein SAMN05443248_2746 [Bradyrhizobium erythrophlei]